MDSGSKFWLSNIQINYTIHISWLYKKPAEITDGNSAGQVSGSGNSFASTVGFPPLITVSNPWSGCMVSRRGYTQKTRFNTEHRPSNID